MNTRSFGQDGRTSSYGIGQVLSSKMACTPCSTILQKTWHFREVQRMSPGLCIGGMIEAQSKSPKPFSESFLISSTIPWPLVNINPPKWCTQESTYIWHYAFSILAFNIAERHFCTFILVDTELRIIDVGDLVKWNFDIVINAIGRIMTSWLTLFLNHHPCDSHSRIRSHLLWAKTPTFKSFLPQLRGPVCASSMPKPMHRK